MDDYTIVGPDVLMDPMEDFFLKNNNSQIYVSAAVSRYLDTPDEVALLLSKDGNELAIVNANSMPSHVEFNRIKTLRRNDSSACRLSGVPRSIMVRLEGRILASEVDKGAVKFPLEEKQ